MSVYEEIKNDPRSFIKQFAGIKRHTTYWMSDMGPQCVRRFGPVATGNFVAVPADSVSTAPAFDIRPNSGESIECYALWDKYLLTRVWNQAPWEAEDTQSVHTDDVTTAGFVMTQVDGEIAIFRVVEQDKLNRVWDYLGCYGGDIRVSNTLLFNEWLDKANPAIVALVAWSDRSYFDKTDKAPAHEKLSLPDPRAGLFGPRDEDDYYDTSWADKIIPL